MEGEKAGKQKGRVKPALGRNQKVMNSPRPETKGGGAAYTPSTEKEHQMGSR